MYVGLNVYVTKLVLLPGLTQDFLFCFSLILLTKRSACNSWNWRSIKCVKYPDHVTVQISREGDLFICFLFFPLPCHISVFEEKLSSSLMYMLITNMQAIW